MNEYVKGSHQIGCTAGECVQCWQCRACSAGLKNTVSTDYYERKILFWQNVNNNFMRWLPAGNQPASQPNTAHICTGWTCMGPGSDKSKEAGSIARFRSVSEWPGPIDLSLSVGVKESTPSLSFLDYYYSLNYTISLWSKWEYTQCRKIWHAVNS